MNNDPTYKSNSGIVYLQVEVTVLAIKCGRPIVVLLTLIPHPSCRWTAFFYLTAQLDFLLMSLLQNKYFVVGLSIAITLLAVLCLAASIHMWRATYLERKTRRRDAEAQVRVLLIIY
jgi:uncharacterized membrane protein YciS (DUF1049 family)